MSFKALALSYSKEGACFYGASVTGWSFKFSGTPMLANGAVLMKDCLMLIAFELADKSANNTCDFIFELFIFFVYLFNLDF